jgi:flagellar capping protein FliD
MTEEHPTDAAAETIFELQQENIRLRGQITYLQEELSSVEDDYDKAADIYEKRFEELEQLISKIT